MNTSGQKPAMAMATKGKRAKDGSVLVTGATGFLGTHLLELLLAEGRAVTIISRRPQPGWRARGVRVVVGSLTERATCDAALAGIATVFHVAARVGVWGRYQDYFEDNVFATRTLLSSSQENGVERFIYTSTPSVVYNGQDLAGVDEALPLTTACPSPYPLTKAIAEREVLSSNSNIFRVCALRPHLIWGVGDPHLVPRILKRARAGRLRIIGKGANRVDMVHVANAAEAHLCAERALGRAEETMGKAAGRAYFITNEEPVALWPWINELLVALGERPVTARLPLPMALCLGGGCELIWRSFGLAGEPPLTRFVAAELAKDHWFSPTAARRDLGYRPRISMNEGMATLVRHLTHL